MGLGRKLRGLKPKHWLALSVAVLILAFGGILGLRYAHLLKCEQQTEMNTKWVAVAIERWKQDNLDFEHLEGASIPDDIAGIIQGYNYELINPFTGSPVRILEWGDPPTPGDTTYLRATAYYSVAGEAQQISETGYHLISYSVKGLPAHRWHWYILIDSDGNGFADPIIYLQESSFHINMKGPDINSGTERLEDVLARNGYTRDIELSLPIDPRPFWRWMFFLEP